VAPGDAKVAASPPGEFPFSDRDYRRIREIAKSRFGLDLGESKRALVYGRLARRLRALGLPDFASYLELIEDADAEESHCLINALTTNVTHFFREEHHFDHLDKTFFPSVLARPALDRKVRIWSAGCSSGEEPYSLAMVAREFLDAAAMPALDLKILATDIDSDVLARARKAFYELRRSAQLTPARLAQHFMSAPEHGAHTYQVVERTRNLVTFNQLNLLEPWPMRGPFDAIFCRNVMIYFDRATKMNLVRRFTEYLRPGGFLFLGHSESLVDPVAGLTGCGKTIYQKDAKRGANGSAAP
jgi:chemotaxis protein methyltransferase CheR